MVRETMFRFVHITDTHIMAGGTWRIRGTDVEFDTDASLRRVVETVRRLQPAPAFAVLGGDLASPDIHKPILKDQQILCGGFTTTIEPAWWSIPVVNRNVGFKTLD